ncbi:type II toxin-antitoxin system ribonuclease VapC1 [Nocardioides hungaricus]
MIIVDASVLAPALADGGASGRIARTRLAGERLLAPELIDLEVTSVIRGLVRKGAVSDEHAAAALVDLIDLPLERVGHRRLVPRCWELRGNLTPYDAAYVALAEHLDVPLVTADARLARASGPRCDVEVLRST